MLPWIDVTYRVQSNLYEITKEVGNNLLLGRLPSSFELADLFLRITSTAIVTRIREINKNFKGIPTCTLPKIWYERNKDGHARRSHAGITKLTGLTTHLWTDILNTSNPWGPIHAYQLQWHIYLIMNELNRRNEKKSIISTTMWKHLQLRLVLVKCVINDDTLSGHQVRESTNPLHGGWLLRWWRIVVT